MIKAAVFAVGLTLCPALALGLLPRGAAAQADSANGAQLAMEALRDAGAALEAANGARDRVAALTETVKAYEAGLAALRDGLRRATIRERAIDVVFDAQSDRLAQLLGVLQTIEAAPETTLLLHPQGPIGTVRAGMILADVTPALAREATDLREQLEEMATLRALQEAALGTLEEGLQGVQRARTQLSIAVANRTDLPRRLVTDPVAMQNLMNSADTLESFAAGLVGTAAIDASVPVENADIASAKGALDMPVLGRVILRANEADAAGVRRPAG